ncbi:hypothetical protein P9738_18650 [Bacillus siamensis]|uniref:hypothetical protein n=1 Tax=Bacillus siamensis TaxID=659243 RepID=UPI002E1A4A0E|nr:hypothetical protein [Bacillus siamensis]
MKWLYQYDENFNYIDAGEIEWEDDMDIPEGYTDVRPPNGLFKAKFDLENQVWKETASKEYIESLQPGPPERTPVDELKAQNAAITEQLAEAQSLAESQAQMIANLYLMLAEGGKGE